VPKSKGMAMFLLAAPSAVNVTGSLIESLARSCALTAVSTWLAALLKCKENTVRPQLREWCYEADAKRGPQRQALGVEACFGPLLAWGLHHWQGPQLALALDATALGTRFSVVYRGCAIPVAWTIVPTSVPCARSSYYSTRTRSARGCGLKKPTPERDAGGGESSVPLPHPILPPPAGGTLTYPLRQWLVGA